MRRVVLPLLALLVTAVSLQAQQDSKLSLLIDAGPSFVTGPKSDRDVSSWGFYGGAELAYRLGPNWSVVPLSLGYTWFSVDKDKMTEMLGSTTVVSDASQSLLTLAPALQVNTDPDRPAQGVFQLGLGWAHSMANTKGTIGGIAGNIPFDEDSNSNDLFLFLGGAVESRLSERVSLTGRLKFWIVFNDESGAGGGGNTNGLNLGLGLRIQY